MSATTKIQWCDATWNPLRGCSRISPGCQNCYAERMAARRLPGLLSPTTGEPFATMTPSGPRWTGRVELIESQLEVPLHWRKPKRIFVNSMSDTFHEAVPDDWIDRIFAVMALCPQHTFMVLTKRAERMREHLASDEHQMAAIMAEDSLFERLTGAATMGHGWPLPNVWLGVSAEDQQRADERIPLLLQTPASRRFISIEPMLGRLDIWQYLGGGRNPIGPAYGGRGLDWVILGGESGPGARPMHPDWARSVRDECHEAGVPYFHKQNGEFVHESELSATENGLMAANERIDHYCWPDDSLSWRVGKKRAGRLLDGREWNEMPEVRK